MKFLSVLNKSCRVWLAPLCVLAGLLSSQQVYAQAAACTAGETLTTFSFTAGSWAGGSLGPNAFNIGTAPNNVTMTVRFIGGPYNGAAFGGPVPALGTIGNTANTLTAARTGAANNSLIGTAILTFDRPVNKFRFFVMDVDASNDSATPSIWQDQIVTTGSLNGAAVAPSALAFVGAGIGTTSIVGSNGTATATWSASPANVGCPSTGTGSANCNVRLDYINPVSQVNVDYREGSNPGVAANNQFVGFNTFSLCVPARAPLAKSYAPSTIGVGTSSTLTFTINNGTGNPAQGNLAFTDTLPAGLTVTAVSALAGAGCTGTPGFSANTVTLTNGWMTAGTASCTFTATVQGVTAGTYTNAPAAFSGVGGALDTSTTTSTLTVLSNPVVGKSFVTSNVAAGATTTMNISVQNTNATAITGAAFTDTYPSGMTGALTATAAPVGCTGTLTAAAGSLALSGGTIPASTTCTYSVVVTGVSAGAKNNTTGAVTTTNAGTGTAANATLNVYLPPTVTKTFTPATITAGATSSMVITVTNPAANPGNLTGVSINDVYTGTLANNAAGGVVCSGGGSATLTGGVNGGTSTGFNAGTIVPGGTCTITQSVTAALSTTNTTTTPAATAPLALTGTAATATLTVTAVPPTIVKSSAVISDPVNGASNPKRIPGAIVEYTITVTNPSVAMSSNSVLVIDPLDANTSLVVSDIAGAGSGPVAFTQGAVSSALTYTYTSAASATDDLEFFNSAVGGTRISVLTPGAGGCDAAVRRIEVNPKGVFADGTGAGADPGFQLRFRVCIR